MGRPAREIRLNEREQSLLEKESNRKSLELRFMTRIQIIVYGFKGESGGSISSKLGVSQNTVSYWRNRWINNYERLQAFSKGVDGAGVSDGVLIKEVYRILSDAPGRGRKEDFTTAQREQIVALACEKPQDYGLPFTHWTHVTLAEEVVSRGIVESISASHIGRILKKGISPS
ncbi:helix-turn-helix domain-containing protein [Catalinimonas sp. 4WD22]|uniref:helix-turn-helix domain-containing protein n=1 Tax=Catalinimonas locisalis TaxID=3133978 RepID=UPI0031010EF4